MRALGHWLGKQGVAVINNVRWGTRETWRYCFSGIPKHSIVCIGTVGGSPRKLCDRTRFDEGYFQMLDELCPTTIVVVGSAQYDCFAETKRRGFEVVQFSSKTAKAFAKGRDNE